MSLSPLRTPTVEEESDGLIDAFKMRQIQALHGQRVHCAQHMVFKPRDSCNQRTRYPLVDVNRLVQYEPLDLD